MTDVLHCGKIGTHFTILIVIPANISDVPFNF